MGKTKMMRNYWFGQDHNPWLTRGKFGILRAYLVDGQVVRVIRTSPTDDEVGEWDIDWVDGMIPFDVLKCVPHIS